MNRINLLLLLISVVFSSCEKSIEDKVHNAVKKYIKENMHDPSSYEDVSWGEVTAVPRDASKLKDPKKLNKQADSLFMNNNSKDSLEAYELQRNARTIEYILEKPEKYTVIHEYRGKNGFGAKVLNTRKFSVKFIDDMSIVNIED